MSKSNRKKNEHWWKKSFLTVFVLMLLLLVVYTVPYMLYKLREDTFAANMMQEETGPQQTGEDVVNPAAQQTEAVPQVEFPVLLDDGKLEIESLFSYDGINPDCSNQETKEIAAVAVTNVSNVVLREATIVMDLSNGDRVFFILTDIPAGKSAIAFSTENLSVQDSDVCLNISCETIWNSESAVVPEGVTVQTDGITVTLSNNSGQDLSDVVIYCKSLLGEAYFGGITYACPVDEIPEGESTTVDADACITGIAEVVRITMNEARTHG